MKQEKRNEEIAFRESDNIVWIAYRYFGGDKEEIAYTQGWDLRGEANPYSALQIFLDKYFTPKRTKFFSDLFPAFIGCNKVYLDPTLPEGIRAVLTAFFGQINLPIHLVKAPTQVTIETINHRWQKAMGAPCPNLDGQALALALLEAGIKQTAA